MVLLTVSNKINGFFGPLLLRSGLKARSAYLRGRHGDTPYLDVLLLIRYAQKIISLEVHDESARMVTKYKDQTKLDKLVDYTFDSMFGKNSDEERLKGASISEIRLETLEDNLRPGLVYNDVWSDVMKWKFNYRVLKWARTELLIAKYGPDVKEALDAYPEIRASPQLSRGGLKKTLLTLTRGEEISFLQNPKNSLLPSSNTLVKAFSMQDWHTDKDTQRTRQKIVQVADKVGGKVIEVDGKLTNYAEVSADADLSELSMEEILELAGGSTMNCGAFNVVCEEADIYQLWTKEYVSILGDYLLDRSSKFSGETTILDVGAGDGLLVRYLKEYFEVKKKLTKKMNKGRQGSNRGDSYPVVMACDDGSWGIFPKADVERIDVETAVKKYAPEHVHGKSKQLIILCSWMPMGVDWSQMFREHNVDEYILIGEADNGSCGDNWKTWGNYDFAEVSDEDDKPQQPFSKDKYKRWNMELLTQHQFSRFDTKASKDGQTVSFRRLE